MISIRMTVWNLFLAVVPVALAYLFLGSLRRVRDSREPRHWPLVLALGFTWLVFVPNACYLLTEWRHFLFNPRFQAARDIDNPSEFSVFRVIRHFCFYAAYSSFGMVCFALSIRPILKWVNSHAIGLRPLAIPFFFLTSLGVYLGLVLRLNSWDFVTRPAAVLGYSTNVLLRPRLLLMVCTFGLGLGAFYVAFDIWLDGLAVRVRGLKLAPQHRMPS